MSLQTIRRIAARLSKAGESRVKIMDTERAGQALTSEDVRGLIKDGVILIEAKRGPTRAGARFKQSRMRAGRRRGKGSQKGSKYAGLTAKDQWIQKVRAQRSLLSSLRSKLKEGAFRSVYRKVKGNAFKNKHALMTYLKENNLFEA